MAGSPSLAAHLASRFQHFALCGFMPHHTSRAFVLHGSPYSSHMPVLLLSCVARVACFLQARYTVQQHERAQHAMQVKLSLLEDQLAATAESARRRMEEQLLTFRGDAATAK